MGKVREVGVKTGGVIADGAMTSDVWRNKRIGLDGVEMLTMALFTFFEGALVSYNKRERKTNFTQVGAHLIHTYPIASRVETTIKSHPGLHYTDYEVSGGRS